MDPAGRTDDAPSLRRVRRPRQLTRPRTGRPRNGGRDMHDNEPVEQRPERRAVLLDGVGAEFSHKYRSQCCVERLLGTAQESDVFEVTSISK